MIHIALFFSVWVLSAFINVIYMMCKNKPPTGKYIAVVVLPVINVLYSFFVVLRFKNFVNPIKSFRTAVKDIISVFKEH